MGVIIVSFCFIIISSVTLLPTLEATCFKVGGLLVPVFTPMDRSSGKLALDIIPQYAQYLKDKGVDGVIVAATTGEGPTLNVSDNKRLLDAWMEAAPPLNLYVLSSVGGVPLPDTQEMSRYSEEIGVDALLAMPEVYYRPRTPEELLYNMQLIAKVAPRTPLLYDDIPQYTNVYVDIVKFFDLATEKIPTFRGVKSDVFRNMLLLRNKARGEQRIFAANYFYLAPEVFVGFKNIVLKELNLFPKLIRDIIRYGEKGNLTESTNLYQRMVDLVEVITEEGNEIAALKAAMPMVTGIDVGEVRPPLIPLTDDQIDDLEERLRGENIRIVKSSRDNQYD